MATPTPSVAPLAIAGLLAACAAPAPEGEWVSLWREADLPPDSPYWWTVSDTVTPAKLRDNLLDREANAKRFRDP